MKMRVCTKCGEEKPETAEYFYRNKTNRSGLNTICKVCCRKDTRRWQAENPEKAKEIRRRWYAENPEKVKEIRRRWQDENPEKVKEYQKKSRRRRYAENPEKEKEASKRWQAENPEKVKEISRRWQAEHPEKAREWSKRCRNSLAPYYLKKLISAKYDIDRSEIGDELINAKRRELKYYRQLKQLKN